MSITLDHLIVPARDPFASAELLARLLGVAWERGDHFTPVYVNADTTLDFDRRETFDRHHYCFRVSEAEFDAIFGRIREAGLVYRSRPTGPDDMQINTRLGGRNVYWNGPDGHIWEILTVSYARPRADISVTSPA